MSGPVPLGDQTAVPSRIATVSLHTSPLDQPGTGDAGGLNVYVVEVARRMAERGVAVDVFTRATTPSLPSVVELFPGVNVRHVPAGPYGHLDKNTLARYLCPFVFGMLRAEAQGDPGHYDLVHGHYWLSGRAGVMAARRWGVPMVQTMHTMARVKNAALAEGDTPEPEERVRGEDQLVRQADRLIANTDDEARQLVDFYGARRDQLHTIPPGVDLDTFTPGSRTEALDRIGLPRDTHLLLFVGRVQRLKAPDVLIRAAAELLERDPSLRDRLVVGVVGGLSGGGTREPRMLADLARSLGVADVVRMEPPQDRARLADYYRAATATVVPSYSESFGLVAVESQACGTPVVASRVGGLTTAVSDGFSGVLIDGHDPRHYAAELHRLIHEPARRAKLAEAAPLHAATLGWSRTVDELLNVYRSALAPNDLPLAEAAGR
ncbi:MULTISPECIES: D-inositol-3-phosphate glycosyltransferase [Nocardiopsis]|uniref:D-inositol-3-phosphate glycosyltransferase n=2 Tax=Nocardiopsis alba TaxID=53437 RepID=A0A7K2IR89_9ACTN|nr:MULTISPECIES: D-inositol-3-phosphate glycosyltransferase [Nocardiopsis]AFR07148.1 D-inositol-3-phosphate glycosyltransferase [Nocardiopsis alba ATCC BAA-2165]MEC3892566.1 D-inositol-3-phosphate glycosyltransferase [Nocardiopsis sp. LDBS1602]MYR32502.1 D-inositol-3-phosphate glycosyltransferase [Nocardiopsis alba]